MQGMKRKLTDNLKRVRHRIADACGRFNRAPSSVRLIAVTKTATMDLVRMLFELGAEHLGESRPQELIRRAAALREFQGRFGLGGDANVGGPRATWHLIGHLQRNKVKLVLPWVDVIHSVDSLRLAEELDLQSAKLSRSTPVFLEVNAGGEATKQGVAVAAATHLAEQIASLRHLELRGLMCMAPLTEDREVIRRVFERTRELFEEIVALRHSGPAFKELSMGMSQDFEWAIEAGATCVRIGSLLFEGIERAPQPAEIE